MLYSEVRQDNCGIYVIRNRINEKMYIGQSHNILWRWTSHRSVLRSGRCPNRHLQFAWNKYGENAFDFSILELCDIEDLDAREEYWIKHLDTVNCGYNIRSGGSSSRGWKMSDEGRKHISDALKGKKKPEWMGQYISERQKRYYESHIPSTSKPVVCLNTGEVFVNATAAHTKYPSADISALHGQCKGKHRSCGKDDNGTHLVWAYKSDYDAMSPEDIATRLKFIGGVASGTKNQRPVVCLDTGELFPSCKDAAMYAGVRPATMGDCLHGRQKCAGKHSETSNPLHWAYAEVC